MSFENILPFIIVSGSFVIALMVSIPLWKYLKWPWEEEPEDDIKKWVQEERRKFKYEEASQTYKELKAVMGEEIDKILEGQDSDSIVEILNYVGRVMSLAGCSMDQMVDAFNALGTPSEETIETPKQKEPQVIFEPKVMIMEPKDQNPIMIADNIISIKQDDKEVNPFDDWYERFMEEVKLG